ncbi:hypothetical protein Tco_1303723 [Tanacetum coccineum]
MYCSMVSAIASVSSSSEYSWLESRLKSSDLNSTSCHALPGTRDKQSVGFVLKIEKILARKSNRKTKINLLGEYVVLDRELDTPYPMEVDTPYSTINQNSLEVGSIWRIQGLDTAYWGFLGVGTMLDIFQNIHILYLEYGVLSLSEYGVLNFIPLWSLMSAGTYTPYLP